MYVYANRNRWNITKDSLESFFYLLSKWFYNLERRDLNTNDEITINAESKLLKI